MRVTKSIRPPTLEINGSIYVYDGKYYRQFDGQFYYGIRIKLNRSK